MITAGRSHAEAVEVIRAIKTSFTKFPQVQRLLLVLDDLLVRPTSGREPRLLMLLGDTGVGKSTLLQHVRDINPPVTWPTYTEVPVLYAPVPPECNIKKLAGAMLRGLGSPFWNKGDAEDRTFQLTVLLRSCHVRLILLDEVNHLVDRGAQRTHHNVADWIKALAFEVHLPLVMAGIPRAARLLEVNDQLRGRCKRITLQAFSFGERDQRREFRSALHTFGGLMVGLDASLLSSEETARRFAFATSGRLRAIRDLLSEAAVIAFSNPDRKLTLEVLAAAFRSAVFEGAADVRNPFSPKFNGLPLIKSGEPFAPAEL